MSATADPGPDALSLVEAGGQLVFQAGSSLKMVPIAMADVSARPSSSSSVDAAATDVAVDAGMTGTEGGDVTAFDGSD